MSGEKLRTTRANLGKVLGPAAMKAYLPVIEDCSERFMDEVLTTKRMALTPDLERLCIQMYAEMLLGRTIPEDLQVCTLSSTTLSHLPSWSDLKANILTATSIQFYRTGCSSSSRL